MRPRLDQGLSVLVVDSSEIVRERLCALLAEVPCVGQVSEAANGSAAWALFEQFLPQAVLLDLHLPDGEGLELVHRIKQASPSCLAIVLTNQRDAFFRLQSHQRGADYFVHKATEFEQLAVLLQRYAEQKSNWKMKMPGGSHPA